MSAPLLSRSKRLRRTPFSDRVEASGVRAYTVYNHMLLPTLFDTQEADYQHLKEHVQVWDVSCERQVEIEGPDAFKLVQMLTPRSLTNLEYGRCFYTPMVDETGGMLNDPVALKVNENRYWISIADSDLLLWVKGIAVGAGLKVDVREPDVSPLAVQGPKSEDLMARVFGDAVRDIRFFRFERLRFGDNAFIVARSGYSKQGGFEIYLEGSENGEALWDTLFAAGEDLNVRAGGPNTIERIEGGLLSYGNDMTRENSPFECGLGKFAQPDEAAGCIGRDALLREAVEGPARQIRGVRIEGSAVPVCTEAWTVTVAGERAGQVTSAAWSPDLEISVAIGMIERAHWEPGTPVEVAAPDGLRAGVVAELPFTR